MISVSRGLPGNAFAGTHATVMITSSCWRVAALQQIGGCDFAVNPQLSALSAPIFWLPSAAPAVVQLIDALPDVGLTSANPAEHIADHKIGGDGLSWIQLNTGVNLVGNLPSDGPVGLLLPLDEDWAVRLAAADRLYRQLLERNLHPPITRQRRERLKRALRTIDGRQRGASYRAVATVFFGAARVSAEPWKTSSLKSQIARLAAYGRMMIDHGYRNLLKGQSR